MAEQISYYWEIDDFPDAGVPLRERLVLIEWVAAPPAPDTHISKKTAAGTKVRVERIANFITVQFFKVYLANRPLPRIVFEEVIEENGEEIRRNKWIVEDAIIPTMDQRDRKEGEYEWATRPHIDEFLLQI